MVVDVPAFNVEEWPDLSRTTQGTVASADTRCDVVVNPDKMRHREHASLSAEGFSVLQQTPDVL